MVAGAALEAAINVAMNLSSLNVLADAFLAGEMPPGLLTAAEYTALTKDEE